MTPSSDTVPQRLIGMIRRPRETLALAIERPKILRMALVVLGVSAACSATFLATPVGRLAALDQQVRQLESFGVDVTESRYQTIRDALPYRAAVSAALIVFGWPLGWLAGAGLVQLVGNRTTGQRVRLAEVAAVFVHASVVLALRSVIAAPVNFARESVGGATSAAMLLPAFAESSFPARLLSAIDLFAVWWLTLVATGLGLLYQRRTLTIASGLFGMYVLAAAVLALVQVVRGGL